MKLCTARRKKRKVRTRNLYVAKNLYCRGQPVRFPFSNIDCFTI